jgi:beta-glucanase (GH16 family)
MKKFPRRTFFLLGLFLGCGRAIVLGDDAVPPLSLLDADPSAATQQVTVEDGQASYAINGTGGGEGLDLAIQPGAAAYPGITLLPPNHAATWDLSAFGHIEALVTNTGSKPIQVILRVDNDDDWKVSPFSANSVTLDPGDSGRVSVVFGYAWGKPGYPLKPAAVNKVMIFTGKTDLPLQFRVEHLQAAGAAGEKISQEPIPVKIKPPGGVMVGAGMPLDLLRQVVLKDDAGKSLASDGHSLVIGFDGGKEQSARVKPAADFWSLTDYPQVRIRLKNTGKIPIRPGAEIESQDGPTDRALMTVALAPGAEGDLKVPFAPRIPAVGVESAPGKIWGIKPGTGTGFTSDLVSGVTIFSDATPGAKSLEVISIKGDVPPIPHPPAWLGQGPPEPGKWTKTFDDEFDEKSVDLTRWNIYTENYWDKKVHFSKDNALVRDGMLDLLFEKKTGHELDDPKRPETAYTTGNLDTYGKWTQRYGYFEARMKVPRVGGLWPAFWLMPDRGLARGSVQADRSATKDGGMEFDIMEFISGWGPYRYDCFMHWGGYEADHHQIGSTSLYVQPDAEGFITSGLLWTPGRVVYYCNGKEIFRWENELVGNQPSFMLLDFVSGGWENVNTPLDDATLPQDFLVDYVRVWQRADLASPVDGPKPNAGTPAAPVQ